MTKQQLQFHRTQVTNYKDQLAFNEYQLAVMRKSIQFGDREFYKQIEDQLKFVDFLKSKVEHHEKMVIHFEKLLQ